MNWYKIIFFHIFQCFYKGGKYSNDIPSLRSTVVVSVSSSFYLLSSFYWIYFLLFNEKPKLAEHSITVCGFLFVIANYVWFNYRRKYLLIYEKYVYSRVNTRIVALACWVYVLSGFATVPISALIIEQLIK